MEGFSIGKLYDEDDLRVVNINPLPENYCSFDCVFCPLGRTAVKTDKASYFDGTKAFMLKLANFMDNNVIDMVFINPDGEGLINAEIYDVVKLIKDRNVKVRLLTNGYILNDYEYKSTLEMCDEVIGELMVTNEEDFHKLNRPINGYTLEQYVVNMAEFRKWYKGKFILDITILKNYSDSDESTEIFKEMITRIKPDEVNIETPSRGKLEKAFGVSKDRLNEIREKCYIK